MKDGADEQIDWDRALRRSVRRDRMYRATSVMIVVSTVVTVLILLFAPLPLG